MLGFSKSGQVDESAFNYRLQVAVERVQLESRVVNNSRERGELSARTAPSDPVGSVSG
jgi:hypothetical protein